MSKRILYIDLAPHPGGSIISLARLLQGLDRTRWRPMVALSRQNEFTGFKNMGVPVVRVRTPQWEKRTAGPVDAIRQGKAGESARKTPGVSRLWHLAGTLRYWRRDIWPVANALFPVIAEYDPALVHLNDSLPLVRHGVLAAWRARRPVLVHSRSLVAPSAYDRLLLAPRLSGMIFISQAVAQHQLQRLGAPPPYRVIPNAVDLERFATPVDRAAVRKALGVPLDAPLIGVIGRIVPWKGQRVFIEAFARLRQRRPDAVAAIVGAPDSGRGEQYRRELQHLARVLGVENSLLWLGRRSDIPQLLASFDILAHCSVEPEPFGRVIIEGMAAGTPVIASDAGGAREIVENEINGLLTPPGDAQALAAAMQRLLEDHRLRTNLQENARSSATQRYNLAAHVNAVTSFYEDILGG